MVDKTIDDLTQAVPETADFVVFSDQTAGPATRKGLVRDIPVPTSGNIWVDSSIGDDATGASGKQNLPFATVGAALAAATAGDVVVVRPGTYPESGLAIPTGVVVTGDHWLTTTIGATGAAANIIALGAGSGLQNVTIQVPSGAFAGVVHSAGTGSMLGCNIAGDGATGAGDGVLKTGTGKLIGGNIRCETGGLNSYLRCDSGVLAFDDVHTPQSAGTIASVVLVEGTGRYQGQGLNIGNTNATDAIALAGTATCIVYSPNIFNVANAVHLTADGVAFTCIGGQIKATARTVWVDPALTGTGTVVRCLSTVLDPLFDFPAAAAGNTDFVLQFNQQATSVRDSRQRLIGADLALGFPELGSGLEVGRGAPYSDGISVVTTDGTETMVGNTVTGGNQTDVTAEAQSRDSSTFSFQGLTANHAIYFASRRTTPGGVALEHWGYLLDQITAGVGGAYVVEVWDGAAWVAVGKMAEAEETGVIYANAVFLRAAQAESVYLGIDSDTTQVLSTVNGLSLYHTRIRVTSGLTTAPTWERVRLMESSLSVNKLGQLKARGLSQWRTLLYGVGNTWGAIGGAGTANVTVGSGALPTGWTHSLPGALLNTNGDGVAWQATIPEGLCTAFPVTFTLNYSLIGAQPVTAAVDINVSVLPLAAAGVQIADPAGGTATIARAVADAEQFDSKAALTNALQSPTGTVDNRPLTLTAGPFDLSGYYAGDTVLVAIEMDADGTPNQDVVLWSLVVEGVKFSLGTAL